MDVVEETINVHRGPGKRANTRAESTFEVINMRSKKRTCVRADLVNNTDSFAYNVLELVVVVLELLFLEKNDLSTIRNSLSGISIPILARHLASRMRVMISLSKLT